MSSSLDRWSKVLFVTAFFLLAAVWLAGCRPSTPTPPPTPMPVVYDDVGLACAAYTNCCMKDREMPFSRLAINRQATRVTPAKGAFH